MAAKAAFALQIKVICISMRVPLLPCAYALESLYDPERGSTGPKSGEQSRRVETLEAVGRIWRVGAVYLDSMIPRFKLEVGFVKKHLESKLGFGRCYI